MNARPNAAAAPPTRARAAPRARPRWRDLDWWMFVVGGGLLGWLLYCFWTWAPVRATPSALPRPHRGSTTRVQSVGGVDGVKAPNAAPADRMDTGIHPIEAGAALLAFALAGVFAAMSYYDQPEANDLPPNGDRQCVWVSTISEWRCNSSTGNPLDGGPFGFGLLAAGFGAAAFAYCVWLGNGRRWSG